MPVISKDKKVTPRGIGTFSKVLEKYVREEQLFSLSEAIARMSYLPAKRLEIIAPIFKKKGRVCVGVSADITIFDPAKIKANATNEVPYQSSTGIHHVFVNGQQVIENEKVVDGIFSGKHLSLIK